jgi:hypothetical protein
MVMLKKSLLLMMRDSEVKERVWPGWTRRAIEEEGMRRRCDWA